MLQVIVDDAEPTVICAALVQPFESVTVTTYVALHNPEAVAVVLTGIEFHEYVYGAVPPVGVAVAGPLQIPQEDGVVEVVDVKAAGCVWGS